MNKPRERSAGFSVLESLIAISIIAGIMAALAPIVAATTRASWRIHANATLMEEHHTTRQFFNDVIKQSVWIAPNEDHNSFSGEASKLTIYTLDPASLTTAPVTLNITGSSLKQLTAQIGSNEANAQTHILIDSLVSAEFEYLLTDGDRHQWKTDWSEPHPPAAIKLSATLEVEGATKNIRFMAPFGGAAPLHCRFDPVSRQCR